MMDVSLHLDAFLDRDSGKTHWRIERYDTGGTGARVVWRDGYAEDPVRAMEVMADIVRRF